MPSTDPIADGLTKIRNATRSNHPTVDLAASRALERILEVLRQEGFIRAFKLMGEQPAQRTYRVYLKYVQKKPVIREVVRMSKPGARMYRGASNLPRVLRGLGVAIISTSKGVMTEREAYTKKIGGEVVCYVW